jgi:alkylated DNA nucleotide flippase Atl1
VAGPSGRQERAGTDSSVAAPGQGCRELPPGSWTSYGDLAALIGSHPVPVGMRIANHPIDNGHRVLQAAGTVSPGFRWYEPGRTDDPVEVLKAEGVEFDEFGKASPAQRFSVNDFAGLLGEDYDEVPGILLIPQGQDEALRDSFVRQLSQGTTPAETQAVLAVVSMWSALGGSVQYGTAPQTSCFLMLRAGEPDSIWPLVIYPTGHLEVVFQYLSIRAPFDEIELRDEFRRRLNAVAGVDIPSAKLALRPNIRAALIITENALHSLGETLAWFVEQVQPRTTMPDVAQM